MTALTALETRRTSSCRPNEYLTDRRWSDKFIPTIKRIVGPYLLEESSFMVDTKQAADLIVLNAKSLSIACRVRRYGFYERYPNQFTVRSKRDSGASTELEKIINGFADWMFYGHADRDGSANIPNWWLLDLTAWRSHMIRRDKQSIKYGQQKNGDGTEFVWFDIASFQGEPRLVIAHSSP